MPSNRRDDSSGTRSANSRRNREPLWVSSRLLVHINQELIAEHGGASGPANVPLLQSACGRAQNYWAYTDPKPDLAALAARLGFGLARNHCFVDGNERTALAAVSVLLRTNGAILDVPEGEAVVIFLDIAAGLMDEEAITEWVRDRMTTNDLSAST